MTWGPTLRMPSLRSLRARSAGLSHPGTVCRNNEDAFLERADLGLWVVADGVGGHAEGAHASRLIVNTLAAVPPPSSAASFLADIDDRLQAVNRALRARAAGAGTGGPIASTVVALLVFGRHFACVWAGDSRLYRLRDGSLRQMTRDHSQVQEWIDSGLLDPRGADRLSLANVITCAVGADDQLVLDRLQGEVSAGDVFLLCTDGLTKVLTDDEIAGILRREPAVRAPRALIDAVLARGASDNVTAVVVWCEPPEERRAEGASDGRTTENR